MVGIGRKAGSFFFIDLSDSSAFVSGDEPPGVPNDLIDPIGQYGRSIGISVTGGYVYRGTAIAALTGRYVFADFFRPSSNRNLLSLDPNQTLETQTITEFAAAVSGNITGFGQDVQQELYIVTNASFGNPLDVRGTLQKIMPLGASYSSPIATGESATCSIEEEGLCFPVKAANGNFAMVCL